MLMPTAGTRLYIARLQGQSVTAALLGSLAWAEIGQTEALGALGGRWDLADGTVIGDTRDVFVKDLQQTTVMQIVLGLDPADAGQLILIEAFRNVRDLYAFRLDFPLMPGQASPARRIWAAMVTSFDEAFDTANGVMKTLVDLIPHSETIRIEAT